jgi:HIT zinc finger
MKSKEVGVAGSVQGYIYQGQSLRQVGNQQKNKSDGMDYRLKFTKSGVTLNVPHGLKLPECLRQRTPVIKERNEQCHNCHTMARKYVCPQTALVSCSFECYKLIKII